MYLLQCFTFIMAGSISADLWKAIENANKELLKESTRPNSSQSGGETLRIKEGDILVARAPSYTSKNGPVTWHRRLWTTREIPYIINHGGTSKHSAASTRKAIKKSMKVIQDATCLIFRPKRSNDVNWIEIRREMGCYSGIGRKYYSPYKPTTISLGENCIAESIIIHEILHALGFPHEQSRRDRDSYVNIYSRNIQPGMKDNFQMVELADDQTGGTPYDLKSIMHYGKTAFTTGNGNTVESKFDPNMKLGSSSLSRVDVAELKELYQCQVTSGWSRWFGWSDCINNWKNECLRSKVRYCVGKNMHKCPGVDEYGTQDIVETCSSCSVLKADGQWSNWGSYGSCSKNCDWGVMKRYRSCSNPPPANGGKHCIGYKMELKACRIKRCSPSSYDLDFENGFGSWTTKGNLAGRSVSGFVRRHGRGPNPGTGPKGAYHSGSGYYAVWPGKDRMYNKKALLISPTVPAGGVSCLIFHYQLNGAQINPRGALSVYLKDVKGKYLNLPFNLGEHQGNYWKRAAVQIPSMRHAFTIEFEARLGYDSRSDVAVDAIFLDSGTCPKGLEGCQDHHLSCQGWSQIGECVKNTVWMSRECCQSCSAFGECTDKHTSCKGWARKGQCSKNARWMWPKCCDACSKACDDYNKLCKAWAKRGECTRNRSWMATNCCKACKKVAG